MTTKLDSKPSRCGMAAKTAAGVPARMRASLPLEFFVVVVTYQRPFANCVDKKGEPSSCSLPGRSWSVAWADEECRLPRRHGRPHHTAGASTETNFHEQLPRLPSPAERLHR